MLHIDYIVGPNVRLADMILDNPALLNAVQRLRIRMGFGEQTLSDISETYDIDLSALLTIVNTYCNRIPPRKSLSTEGLFCLLAFLKNSHEDFRNTRIPAIERLIAAFASEIPAKRGDILIRFFKEYSNEAFAHFDYEEQTVFPYVTSTLKGIHTGDYMITEFTDNHTDIEGKLYDLQCILLKYIPEAPDSPERIELLQCLFDFERQLHYHTALEDLILVPAVKKLESASNNRSSEESIAARIKHIRGRTADAEKISLTQREREVLCHLVKGMSNKEVANKLHISAYTVISHRKSIIEKTGIHSLAGLTVYALLNNICEIESIR